MAVAIWVDTRRFICVGQEINANHLLPATGGWVTGTARPIHLGRRSQCGASSFATMAGG